MLKKLFRRNKKNTKPTFMTVDLNRFGLKFQEAFMKKLRRKNRLYPDNRKEAAKAEYELKIQRYLMYLN